MASTHIATVPRFAPTHDPLTGLLTQAAFTARLDQLLARSVQQTRHLTLALLQLDNFYEVRQWVGKSEANLLLGDIARLLQQTVPPGSWTCRCQNHEFAVLLHKEGSRSASRLADAIRQAAQQASSHALPPQLTLQCGVGLTVLDGLTPNANVAFARARHDLWLHRRKDGGLGIVIPRHPDSQALLEPLRQALAARQAALSYQPLLAVPDLTPTHVEARASLLCEDGSGSRWLPPAACLDAILQFDLGESLDRLVLELALGKQNLQQLLPACGQAPRLLVNLTHNSVVSSDFLPWLRQTLKNAGDRAADLVLQISEIDVLIAQHHMDAFVDGLRTLGVALAINHFGCTPQPQRYLSLCQPRYVRLDRCLLDTLQNDPQQRQRLAPLVRELKDEGLMVIAPQVESLGVLPWLWQAGVDLLQGHALQAPTAQPLLPDIPRLTLGA
ncbi:MAG: hypothetical protein RLZZ385_1186 [Pseudomonadota bacterium]|jgi:diguanylate cyclase (GGDEF)-like protein